MRCLSSPSETAFTGLSPCPGLCVRSGAQPETSVPMTTVRISRSLMAIAIPRGGFLWIFQYSGNGRGPTMGSSRTPAGDQDESALRSPAQSRLSRLVVLAGRPARGGPLEPVVHRLPRRVVGRRLHHDPFRAARVEPAQVRVKIMTIRARVAGRDD